MMTGKANHLWIQDTATNGRPFTAWRFQSYTLGGVFRFPAGLRRGLGSGTWRPPWWRLRCYDAYAHHFMMANAVPVVGQGALEMTLLMIASMEEHNPWGVSLKGGQPGIEWLDTKNETMTLTEAIRFLFYARLDFPLIPTVVFRLRNLMMNRRIWEEEV